MGLSEGMPPEDEDTFVAGDIEAMVFAATFAIPASSLANASIVLTVVPVPTQSLLTEKPYSARISMARASTSAASFVETSASGLGAGCSRVLGSTPLATRMS